jgi:hypothetical protein
MNTNYTIGTKFMNVVTFKDGHKEEYGPKEIHEITATRVCYNDGKKHLGGATNRNVFGSWLGVKRFDKEVANGGIKIID